MPKFIINRDQLKLVSTSLSNGCGCGDADPRGVCGDCSEIRLVRDAVDDLLEDTIKRTLYSVGESPQIEPQARRPLLEVG